MDSLEELIQDLRSRGVGYRLHSYWSLPDDGNTAMATIIHPETEDSVKWHYAATAFTALSVAWEEFVKGVTAHMREG